jgi:SAM-dependent methyltransferase
MAVVACDASPKMAAQARRRAEASPYGARIDVRLLATERIADLAAEGPFDGVLSNFAGLNCVEDLRAVAGALTRIVRPGGAAVLCVFGRFCLWELCWYLARANPGKATRRFRPGGVTVRIAGGAPLAVHYPSVGALRQAFASGFRLERQRGAGIAVPPSYVEKLAVRRPRLMACAAGIDPWLGRCPGLRSLADHRVLTFRRVEGA